VTQLNLNSSNSSHNRSLAGAQREEELAFACHALIEADVSNWRAEVTGTGMKKHLVHDGLNAVAGDREQARQPHPLDVALGSHIRLRRRELGLSQDELAREIGITFQQVQKYERGTNRVSFSRLVEIAHVLRCGVVDIVSDLDKSNMSAPFSSNAARLNLPGAAELLEAHSAIQSPKQRRAIINLAKQLAEEATQLCEIEDVPKT
jgi:transcriptional regulator with XRE-family HTH domain